MWSQQTKTTKNLQTNGWTKDGADKQIQGESHQFENKGKNYNKPNALNDYLPLTTNENETSGKLDFWSK